MAKHYIGMDPAEVARQRKARASQGATEHPADVAAYIQRTKATKRSIPTPGAPPPEPEASQPALTLSKNAGPEQSKEQPKPKRTGK